MTGVDPRIEERVGSALNEKWTLERLIGTGGMAAVYLAKHRNGARAAVKILHPEIARHAQIRERFLREGYAANKVEHRGTAQVLDDDIVKDGPDAGAAYIVMELLDGESVDEKFDRGHVFGDREILELLAAVLDVLQAAHERGVIHRDLKPDNLFYARDPDSGATRLKVLDFGLARIAEAESVTVDGLALGTPHYMPPEQASGAKDEIDARTDIFALGATAFFLLARRHVHEAETVLQTVVKMGKDPAPPLRSVAPQVGEPTARIIDRALAFAKADRYPTAAAMRVDVDAALAAMDVGEARTIELYAPTSRQMAASPPAEKEKKEKAETISLSASDLDPAPSEPELPPPAPPPPPPRPAPPRAPAPVAPPPPPAPEPAPPAAEPPQDEPRPSTRETARMEAVEDVRPSTRETANMKVADELVALSRKSKAEEEAPADPPADARPSTHATTRSPAAKPTKPKQPKAPERDARSDSEIAEARDARPNEARGFPWVRLTMATVATAVLVVYWPEIRARVFPMAESYIDGGAVTTTEGRALDAATSEPIDAPEAPFPPDAENLVVQAVDAGDDDDDIPDHDAAVAPPSIIPSASSAPRVWKPPPVTTQTATTKKPPTKPPPPHPTTKPPPTKKK